MLSSLSCHFNANMSPIPPWFLYFMRQHDSTNLPFHDTNIFTWKKKFYRWTDHTSTNILTQHLQHPPFSFMRCLFKGHLGPHLKKTIWITSSPSWLISCPLFFKVVNFSASHASKKCHPNCYHNLFTHSVDCMSSSIKMVANHKTCLCAL